MEWVLAIIWMLMNEPAEWDRAGPCIFVAEFLIRVPILTLAMRIMQDMLWRIYLRRHSSLERPNSCSGRRTLREIFQRHLVALLSWAYHFGGWWQVGDIDGLKLLVGHLATCITAKNLKREQFWLSIKPAFFYLGIYIYIYIHVYNIIRFTSDPEPSGLIHWLVDEII